MRSAQPWAGEGASCPGRSYPSEGIPKCGVVKCRAVSGRRPWSARSRNLGKKQAPPPVQYARLAIRPVPAAGVILGATIALATLRKFPIRRIAAAPRMVVLLLSAVLAPAFALYIAQGVAAAPSAWFTFSPAAPFTDETVTFASASTGVTEPQRWDLDGDGSCDDATGTSAQRSFRFAGQYSITLCAGDGSDEVFARRRVIIQNRAPVAAFAYAPASPFEGDSIMLTSTSADPDGPIFSQSWDLDGDGSFDDATGAVASVSFVDPGTYVVRLLVSDRDGAATVGVVPIAVGARPLEQLSPFPIVRIVARVGLTGTRVRELDVDAPSSASVKIRCRGKGCPFGRVTRAAPRISRLLRIRRLRRHVLRPGALLQVWVTEPEQIGKYTRFRIRDVKRPSRADGCVMPGRSLPVGCSSL